MHHIRQIWPPRIIIFFPQT
nr:unnamed protein product [Callosobruchus chinensis]